MERASKMMKKKNSYQEDDQSFSNEDYLINVTYIPIAELSNESDDGNYSYSSFTPKFSSNKSLSKTSCPKKFLQK